MRISDFNNVISEINSASKQKKLSSAQMDNLIDTASTIDNVVFTELKVSSWKDVGTKKFGIRGEKAVLELKNLFNQYMSSAEVSKIPPATTSDEILDKNITPSEPALPSVTLEAMCICPEDYGIIREWNCPKHGHVESKKPNPLEP